MWARQVAGAFCVGNGNRQFLESLLCNRTRKVERRRLGLRQLS